MCFSYHVLERYLRAPQVRPRFELTCPPIYILTMQKPSLSSVVLLLTVGLGSASDICTYTSRACVPASFGCCLNIPQNTCCYWPNNYGWSVKFQNMPSSPWAGGMFPNSACLNRINGVGVSQNDLCKRPTPIIF